MKTRKHSFLAPPTVSRKSSGFSLVELLVAMFIFVIISGAAIRLVQKHAPMATAQQNQAGLNFTMRNAVTQMQVDVVNAGTGYYAGANIPSWPIGLTILNCGDIVNGCNAMTGNATCYNAVTLTYGQSCFDQLNIITTNPAVNPSHSSDNTGIACAHTDTSTALYATPTGTDTPATLAANFRSGDELLLVKSDGSQMTVVILTANGVVNGGMVQLAHSVTNSDGTNTSDPYGIANSTDASTLNSNGTSKLGTQFCPSDWILKLSVINYSVNAANNANPQLVRSINGANPVVIADQIIGFKVGAMTWNTTANDDQATYLFNAPAASPANGCASNCGFQNDWSLVRSVLVSVIGRTASTPADPFRNSFDGGPYKVQSVSVVINPRNLSMNDQ
ncbi:MAG TPA: prepilin-type N-terminal cleavage/methylation domain-containing protein [Candidatus Angelobacter sp.]